MPSHWAEARLYARRPMTETVAPRHSARLTPSQSMARPDTMPNTLMVQPKAPKRRPVVLCPNPKW